MFFAIILTGCASSKSVPPADEDIALVVVISVDQMRADYLERFAHRYTGGLKKLVSEGQVFTNAHQDHAITATSPGHAAISTGTYPRKSGIVSNSWWDKESWRGVYSVEDEVPLLGINGEAGRSPANLQRSTIGDWLKESYPGSKVYAVGLKDRATILMAGHKADAAYWYYAPLGYYVTSEYYHKRRYPAWLMDFNAQNLPLAYWEQEWEHARPADSYTASREDPYPHEHDGEHTAFPHEVPGDSLRHLAEFRYVPFSDGLTFKLAETLIAEEDLGKDNEPDLLFIAASAADYIGHRFGPYSHEIEDYYIRLDEYLQELMEFLGSTIDKGRVLVVLTSDHGVLPLPEELNRRSIDSKRVNERKELAPIVQSVLNAYKINTVKASFVNGITIQFDKAQITPALEREIFEAMADAIRDHPDVVDAYTIYELAGADSLHRNKGDQFRKSYFPGRTSDITVQWRSNVLVSEYARGTTHLSPYDYDTHIPLIFWGKEFQPAQSNQYTRAVDIAPTLAEILKIPVPVGVDGKKLALGWKE